MKTAFTGVVLGEIIKIENLIFLHSFLVFNLQSFYVIFPERQLLTVQYFSQWTKFDVFIQIVLLSTPLILVIYEHIPII